MKKRNRKNEKKLRVEKTRSLDLSRVRRHFQKMSGRQTDKQFFFSKALSERLFTHPSFFSTIQSHQKRNKKPLKQLCDRRTDGRTDGPTDQKVAYRVA